ncbi:PAS domain-containing protein [Psychrobacter sp. JCM 18903]|uniref:PAS domain-containing protein n=1 Tax=Psychrobacter sp. JCM 18903 TaxID=1298610 RepID=UPI0004AE7E24|nr:PAS domain-containing protein [Psychrobacter sp. JCM 18903]
MGSPIPDAHKPDMPAEQITLTYYDGTSRTVYDTGIERPYPDGKLIVSRTDLDGVLTHVNDAFVEISGYSVDELIGQPQSILRHPDMPKAAYKDLWDTAAAGQKWHGYVKNLCKDGSHYWSMRPLCQTFVAAKQWVIPRYAVSHHVAKSKLLWLSMPK